MITPALIMHRSNKERPPRVAVRFKIPLLESSRFFKTLPSDLRLYCHVTFTKALAISVGVFVEVIFLSFYFLIRCFIIPLPATASSGFFPLTVLRLFTFNAEEV
jgi:hypothetical protein